MDLGGDDNMRLLERVKASYEARIEQPWVKAHFDKTPYGRTLEGYKGKYKNKRCFFIGNGPSLCAEDLTKLYNSGDVTFAFNRIYNIFDQTLWRPTFYISQDEKMLMGCAEIVDQLPGLVKFIPINLLWYYNINIHDANWFLMRPSSEEKDVLFDFSDEVNKQIFQASTGMYTAAQLAAYMGFKEIYFIGVDHHFRTSINNQGEIIVDTSVKDYFSEKYNEDKANLYIPNTEKSTLTYAAMKFHCDQRGIKIFNATRGGKLEIFPRVDFDSLF